MEKYKVGIYGSNRKTTNYAVKQNLSSILLSYGFKPVDIDDNNPDKDIKCLFIIGGDGTILNFASFLATNRIPVIGINGGRFGFLAEFEDKEVEEAVRLFSENALKEDFRTLIEVSGNSFCKRLAINDVSVQRTYNNNPDAVAVTVRVAINGTVIDTVKGDGVIISTPTGSTAYSLSAGGSIIDPKTEAFSVTPICPHSTHNRPVVVSSESVITVMPEDKSFCGIFADGKYIADISDNSSVTIKRASEQIVFLRRNDSDFYKKLRVKFAEACL